MIAHNVIYANGAYLYKQFQYESADQYAFSIVEHIEQDADYVYGKTPVAIIGDMYESNLLRDEPDCFSPYWDLTGTGHTTAITYLDTLRSYCRFVLGRNIPLVNDDPQTLADLAARPEVQEMPAFPKTGFCQIIDGVMVVKLQR